LRRPVKPKERRGGSEPNSQQAPFTAGLELIKRRRPVSFNWIGSNERDLGLIAEEVAKLEPLLVTRNDRGEGEGLKYDRINVALVNAVKQQQEQIKQQQRQIDSLKKIICLNHPDADICR
jgi:hypothetical protein